MSQVNECQADGLRDNNRRRGRQVGSSLCQIGVVGMMGRGFNRKVAGRDESDAAHHGEVADDRVGEVKV